MQRYGQICIVCYNCETHLPFMTKCDLIFSQMRAGRFSHMCADRFSHMCADRFSHKCNPKTADGAVGQFTLVSRDPKHLFTFSGNTADQHEWGTGEFLSYYIYN